MAAGYPNFFICSIYSFALHNKEGFMFVG